jgi:hypothetical protein
VPFDVEVTLKNLSPMPVVVGLAARLTLTADGGQRFSPDAYLPLQPQLPSDNNALTLSGGESRDFFVSWYQSAEPWFYRDDAYSGPGTYSVSLELIANEQHVNYVGPIFTNAARLTREVAKGEDEALWDKMKSVAHGHWTDSNFVTTKDGLKLLSDILQGHPTSRYYPYALVMDAQVNKRVRTTVDIDVALEAAARFSWSPAYPYLLLRAAEVAESIAAHAWWSKDEKTAQEWRIVATQRYSDTERKAPSLAARYIATRQRILIRDQMERERDSGVVKN